MNRYCGREFTNEEMAFIRQLIEVRPDLNRYKLSHLVCEYLNWRKQDGDLKDMSCRVAMLRMQQDGLIQLPTSLKKNKDVVRIDVTPATNQPSIVPSIKNLCEVEVHKVTSKKESCLWNEYIQRYHYLGYTRLPGNQMRYFVKYHKDVIGLLGFGAAAWKTSPRDRFVGWDHNTRQYNLHLVVNNARFLVLPKMAA